MAHGGPACALPSPSVTTRRRAHDSGAAIRSRPLALRSVRATATPPTATGRRSPRWRRSTWPARSAIWPSSTSTYPFSPPGLPASEVAEALARNNLRAIGITPEIYTREFCRGAFTNPDPAVRAADLRPGQRGRRRRPGTRVRLRQALARAGRPRLPLPGRSRPDLVLCRSPGCGAWPRLIRT